MKKFLYLFMLSFMVIGLSGCDIGNLFNKEENQDKAFAKYLDSQEPLSAAKLDDSIGAINLDMADDLLENIEISNSKLKLTMNGKSETAYMWKKVENNDDYLYAGLNYYDNYGDERNESYKVNLSEVQEMFNNIKDAYVSSFDSMGFLEDTNDSNYLEASEIIDNYIATQGVDTAIFNVNNILSKIDFDIDDFVSEGKGVYRLKMESFISIAEEITGEEFEWDIEELEEMLTIKVKFLDNHIENISLKIKNEVKEIVYGNDYGIENVNISLSFDFTYSDNKLEKINTNFVENYSYEFDGYELKNYASSNILLSSNELTASFSVGETSTNIDYSYKASVKKENGKIKASLKIVEEGKTLVNGNVEFVGNWLSAAELTLVMEDDTINIEIEGNVNVSIPAKIKNSETFDVTDLLFEYINSAY